MCIVDEFVRNERGSKINRTSQLITAQEMKSKNDSGFGGFKNVTQGELKKIA